MLFRSGIEANALLAASAAFDRASLADLKQRIEVSEEHCRAAVGDNDGGGAIAPPTAEELELLGGL